MSGIFLESWKKLVSKQTRNQAMINQVRNEQVAVLENRSINCVCIYMIMFLKYTLIWNENNFQSTFTFRIRRGLSRLPF